MGARTLPRLTAGPAWAAATRLSAAWRDSQLAEQLCLVEVQVEAGDLALLELVDTADAQLRRLAGRGYLAGGAAEGAGVRADAPGLVHAAPVVGVDGDR